MSILQIRVDDNLKNEVSDLFERLGMDIPTAVRIFFKRRDEIPPMFLTLFGHIDPKYCVTNFCGAAGETERPKIPLNLNPGEPEKSGSDRVRRKRELSGSAPENKARKTQGGAAKTLPPHYNNFPFK